MISSLADVKSLKIGEGTSIWQFCVVLPGAIIGKNCNINCNVFIENDVIIGNEVTVKSGVQIWDGVRIGNSVFIGPNVTFSNDLFPRSKSWKEETLKTFIYDGASLGANATILAGITIHRHAMIGAGSVLTKSAPPFTLWYGNPAKQKGYVTKDGITTDMNLLGKNGKQYQLFNEEPIESI